MFAWQCWSLHFPRWHDKTGSPKKRYLTAVRKVPGNIARGTRTRSIQRHELECASVYQLWTGHSGRVDHSFRRREELKSAPSSVQQEQAVKARQYRQRYVDRNQQVTRPAQKVVKVSKQQAMSSLLPSAAAVLATPRLPKTKQSSTSSSAVTPRAVKVKKPTVSAVHPPAARASTLYLHNTPHSPPIRATKEAATTL
ncbi:hypothetical protein C8R43DRAFT_965972 [Mycena crocata]|nr:hypothetical protein C8R43DRAFT_965972 [Mycena crocata]